MEMMRDEGTTEEREVYPQLLLENQLCFPLYAAARKITGLYTPLLKPLNLTYTQNVVCLALWEKGETTVGDLCRRLRLDCGTLTPLLKKLEEQELITRSRSRSDERVVMISMTEKGWQKREKAKEIPSQIGQCVRLTREEAELMHSLLNKLLG